MTTIKNLLPSLGRYLSMTDQEWDEHDRAVQKRFAEQSCVGDEAGENIIRLCRGGVPDRMAGLVWGGRYLHGQQEALLAGFETDERHIRVLSGGIGSGKTWAAIRWLGQHGGRGPLFMRINAFEVAGRYDRTNRAAWQHCTAMVLDDLGAEYLDGHGNLRSDLDELIDHFCTVNQRLIITTNLTPEPFRARYGERMISRLREHCRWKVIKTPDQRGKRVGQS